MKLKITFAAALLALLIVPQALAAPGQTPARKAATAACKAEAKQIGRTAFRAAYGRTAMRNCIRAVTPDARAAIRNAAQECREEMRADRDAFREKYGTNANKRNAFGKCVSGKARRELAEETDEVTNASKECRAERAADPDAFAETYGTNPNNRNAFGKCVSQKAREADEGEGEGPSAPPAS